MCFLASKYWYTGVLAIYESSPERRTQTGSLEVCHVSPKQYAYRVSSAFEASRGARFYAACIHFDIVVCCVDPEASRHVGCQSIERRVCPQREGAWWRFVKSVRALPEAARFAFESLSGRSTELRGSTRGGCIARGDLRVSNIKWLCLRPVHLKMWHHRSMRWS